MPQLKQIYGKLTPWQKAQVARHVDRPHTLDYIAGLVEDFTPLAGDRAFAEDAAMVGGIGRFRGARVRASSARRRAPTPRRRLRHNFGMPRPEGYRKAQRLMRLADRFGLPVVTFVDTPGAYPGVDAEARGQAEAIARSIETCLALGVPLVSVVIGEGGSGGALALAAGNRVMMLEHAIYSVISPEGCASILWRDGEQAQTAAQALRLTAKDLLELGVIDEIIAEPLGGAHRSPPGRDRCGRQGHRRRLGRACAGGWRRAAPGAAGEVPAHGRASHELSFAERPAGTAGGARRNWGKGCCMQDDRPFVLVTGGAGYIGSHVVHALRDAGWPVVVVDDLSTGRRAAVPEAVPLIEGDIGDRALMDAALARHTPIAVMHFAGSIVVPELVTDPLRYYSNNTAASLTLISPCVAAGVDNFIFSSTAAVYGEPERSPVAEDDPTAPINPYGSSKLCTEWILRDTTAATPLRYVALRYFNVAGADPDGRTGQSTEKATHLIKVACQAALGLRARHAGLRRRLPDRGRHLRARLHPRQRPRRTPTSRRWSIWSRAATAPCSTAATATAFPSAQVLETVRDAAGGELSWRIAPRRAGDPPELVSASGRIREVLGWEPRYDDLGFIVETAMDWERRLRDED